MDYKKLEELNNLRLSGALTEEEFEAEKKKLYDEDFPPIAEPLPLGLQESSYLGLMYFPCSSTFSDLSLPITHITSGATQPT